MNKAQKKHPWTAVFAALLLLACLAWLRHNRIHFDFRLFRLQLARADWGRIALAIALIHAGIVVRSLRWMWLLRHRSKVSFAPLLAAHMIGFAAVALFGRVADLTRPYLAAKRTGVSLSIQLAVYVIERLFDALMLALLFGGAVFLAHFQSGILRKAALAAFSGAIIGAAFLAALGLAGETVPTWFERLFTPLSKRFACAAVHKLRGFQAGLHAMRSLWDVAAVTAFSACLWGLIAMAYFETTRAFVADRQLAALPFARCIPLLALSSGASFFQLPVLGWFSQIGLVAAGISAIYRVPAELSAAWSATLLLVTLLSPAPAGLIWARLQGISLRKAALQASSETHAST